MSIVYVIKIFSLNSAIWSFIQMYLIPCNTKYIVEWFKYWLYGECEHDKWLIGVCEPIKLLIGVTCELIKTFNWCNVRTDKKVDWCFYKVIIMVQTLHQLTVLWVHLQCTPINRLACSHSLYTDKCLLHLFMTILTRLNTYLQLNAELKTSPSGIKCTS